MPVSPTDQHKSRPDPMGPRGGSTPLQPGGPMPGGDQDATPGMNGTPTGGRTPGSPERTNR